MAYSSVMIATPPSDLLNLMQSQPQTGADYLKFVSNIVSTNKSKTYKIKSPAGATWTVGDVDDTIYSDDDDAVYAWENFYLRKEVCMQVLGVLEGTAFSGEQPVLMTCEDSKMYVYDGDELHLVASSLEQLCKKGIDYPPSVTYCYGDAFKEMTNKDWDKVKKGPVGRKLEEDHHQLVMSVKSKILSNLPATK